MSLAKSPVWPAISGVMRGGCGPGKGAGEVCGCAGGVWACDVRGHARSSARTRKLTIGTLGAESLLFNGEPFHIAIARPAGSFEFTYGEIGRGTTTVTGDLEMAFEDSWALFCVHHYNQDGLVRERPRITKWLGT